MPYDTTHLVRLLRNFRWYRRWIGGKWVLFDCTWYPARTFGPMIDFVDCDDGKGMFHYTYSGVTKREDWKLGKNVEQ